MQFGHGFPTHKWKKKNSKGCSGDPKRRDEGEEKGDFREVFWCFHIY